ncbi:MAG: PAS domain-containing protein [Methylobacterium sp.]|uniref:PAS domain-containing protein n=1 Tax=unclassified Methylobacterium TaxID=2615210 RepID=UPI000A5D3B67|nr:MULTISPECIES: PAS domain-containing protein [unclassified Methylobacterium]MDO9429507.1 PAS domain-containing protein [Methylobacterium sp.]
MSRPLFAMSESEAVQAALVASGVVGLWTYDIWADRLVLSGTLPEVLGLEPTASGVPLGRLLDGTHGEDRERVENVVHAAVAGGAPFDVAFRTASGGRSLSLRGRIERDGAGQPRHGRGIALDLTHEGGLDRPGQHAVNRMAEHAIALHGLVGHLHHPSLARLLDSLMREIGRELARHLQGKADARRH